MTLSTRAMAAVSERRHQGGFTLVELLVAFALFALISLMLAGGLRFGIRAWETGRERAEPTSEIELAQNLLRRELSQAAAPRDAGDAARAFVGAMDRLAFSGPLPAPAAAGEPYAFLLRAAGGAGRTDLALQWRPAAMSGEAATGSAVLLEGIAGFELAYFGATAPGQAPAWSAQWSGAAGLPKLIRMRVIFPAGDRRLWPDLFVAPRYEALR